MNWPIVTLGDICEIVSGATPKTSESAYWGGEIHWATPKDLSQLAGSYISSTNKNLTHAGLKSCSARLLPPYSVLLSSRAPIGLVAINTVPMATNQGFKSLVPNTSRVDPRYLYHWLRTNTALLQELGTGATFKEISKKTTSSVQIPLPPLDEQRRIALALGKVDSQRQQLMNAVSCLDELYTSLQFRAFRGEL